MAQSKSIATDRASDRIGRPLHVLAPLIHHDLQQGKDAAQRAAMPYYRAAGEKLIEAKEQQTQDEFFAWVKRVLGIGKSTAYVYMNYAATVNDSSALEFSTLTDFIRKTSQPNYNRPPGWSTPVTPPARPVPPVDPAPGELERHERQQLAQQMIALGYKALAMKLHPDQQGSSDAMIRVNLVRDWLKTNVDASFSLRFDPFWRGR